MRVLKNDFARYNLDDDEADELDQEENGWKIVHTDVFRFPPYKSLLCSILGMKCAICTTQGLSHSNSNDSDSVHKAECQIYVNGTIFRL